MSDKVDGTLLIIGGAEDKTGECEILNRFISLSGSKKAHIVLMTTAAQEPAVLSVKLLIPAESWGQDGWAWIYLTALMEFTVRTGLSLSVKPFQTAVSECIIRISRNYSPW